MKDNSAFDGKFFVDSNRNYNNVDNLPDQLNVTGSLNADGKPMGIIPTISGEDENDTSNYGAGMWVGNSGLDAYMPPMTFWIGDTEVTKDDEFTSIKKVYVGDMHLITKKHIVMKLIQKLQLQKELEQEYQKAH